MLAVAASGMFLVCSMVSLATAQVHNHNSFLGKRPPEIVSRTAHWLGWPESVTLEKLKGQVIWLQFNF